jgi:hypothetical protein
MVHSPFPFCSCEAAVAYFPLSVSALRACGVTAAYFALALFDLCADIRLLAP